MERKGLGAYALGWASDPKRTRHAKPGLELVRCGLSQSPKGGLSERTMLGFSRFGGCAGLPGKRKLSIRDKIAVERYGNTVATVHKALVGIRARFAIDVEHGADMKAHGNVVDHEYEIERDGDTVATISKKWFRVRESYGVDVAAGEDAPLILAITVAIDSLTSRD
jgi:hypothetical protein